MRLGLYKYVFKDKKRNWASSQITPLSQAYEWFTK